VWECKPDFKTACAAWIYAGGAHHTGYSYSVTTEMLEDFRTIAASSSAVIDADPKLRDFRQNLRNSEIYYYSPKHSSLTEALPLGVLFEKLARVLPSA